MDAAASTHWSRQRWTTVVGLVIMLHLAVPMFLRGPAANPVRDSPGLFVRATVPTGRPANSLARWYDPTLLALPHLHDFSGTAWLRPEPLTYQFSDSSEPARWLAADPDRLGVGGAGLSAADAGRLPELTNQRPEPSVPVVAGLTLPVASQLRLEGELARGGLAVPLELPVLIATNLMTNSVVQVLVNAQGLVLSARLLSAPASRSPEQVAADARALELARAAQFTPAPDKLDRPRHGRMTFRWATRPQSAASPGLP